VTCQARRLGRVFSIAFLHSFGGVGSCGSAVCQAAVIRSKFANRQDIQKPRRLPQMRPNIKPGSRLRIAGLVPAGSDRADAPHDPHILFPAHELPFKSHRGAYLQYVSHDFRHREKTLCREALVNGAPHLNKGTPGGVVFLS
jgi:hypothetical protein